MAKTTKSSAGDLPDSASGLPAVPELPVPASYEAALRELESLVSGLDSGQLPLEQLLGAYQRGAQLLAYCKSKLESVEEQIKVLEGNGLKPWSG